MNVMKEDNMEDKKKYIFDKVTEYADEVNKGINPEKVQVSYQLERLKPVMEELAKELNEPVEDIFISYMDSSSDAGL